MADTTPDFEAQRQVRDAYTLVAAQAGNTVAAAAVRTASGLSDTTFNQAVAELAACPDIALSGYSVFTGAWGNRTAAQIQDIKDRAPLVGGQHITTVAIGGPALANTWRPEYGTTQRPAAAATQAHWLPRAQLERMAAAYGVDTTGSDQAIRDLITEQARRNHDAWRATVRQETTDLQLLYDADQAGAATVAGWPAPQRTALAAAAARQIEQSWPIGRDRAQRWQAALAGGLPQATPGPGDAHRRASTDGITGPAALAAAFATPHTGPGAEAAGVAAALTQRPSTGQPAATTAAGPARRHH